MAGAIVVALFVASFVLAWWTVRSGSVSDGWEIVPFILFPLLAAVIASIAISLLMLLGVTVSGAVVLSRGRVRWMLALVPLAVLPVLGIAVWPWTLGPARAAALCQEAGGFRGTPISLAGFSDAVSGLREGWKQELATRLLVDGYLFVEEPAEVARERVQSLDSSEALNAFDSGSGDFVRYFVAQRDHQGCGLLPGVVVHPSDVAGWRELGLPSGACLAAERTDRPVARYELRPARERQFWPTYAVWHETRVVELASGEVAARFRAFGPPLDVGEGFEDVMSGNPLRVLSAYLSPRQPCGDNEAFLDAIETTLPPLSRAAAVAVTPPPIGRLDFAPRRLDAPDAPFESGRLFAAEIAREEVAPLGAPAFHAAKDVFEPNVIRPVFEAVGTGSPADGIGVAGPPTRPEELLFIDTGPRIVEIRLRGFLPEDPRPLRVHRARREEGGVVVLASFTASEDGLESRTFARLRFDGEGHLQHAALAELPLLERPPNTVATFLREAKPLADGGLALVLHHAASYGAATSREYRIRLERGRT
jgi:hypothetical protein